MAANGYQKHILIGNLGADPKVTTTQNGNTVTNFDIAVNERNADGTEIVTWYGIAAWNGLGEVCAQYLKKGRQVMVEGTRMNCTAWFGRDNHLYTKMELTANEVKFLGGNGVESNGNGVSHTNGVASGVTVNADNDGGADGNHNSNYNHYENRKSASIKKRPTNQPKHEPQAPHQPPAQHAPHQPQHASDEWQYSIPHNPDEIPF